MPSGTPPLSRALASDACPHGTWEVVRALPHPRLRPGVLGYRGYRMDLAHGRRRLELPDGCVSLVFNLADPVWVTLGTRHDAPALPYTTLLSGLQTRPTFGEHAGRMEGVEVLLAPWEAFGILGHPMADLADRMTDPAALLGARADLLAEALHEATGWPARFALLDDTLHTWAEATPARAADPLRHAWSELLRSGGGLPVGELALRSGRGTRRLEYLFREQIGLTPKTAARVLRFRHAVRLIGRSAQPLVDVAAACGFSDQAHMNRDFTAMSGRSPLRFRRERAASPPGPAWVDRVTGQVTSVVLPDSVSRS
ncbi:helix-turn-helix domain-containing protein [Streptomyces sp. NPDC016845]|uniref:helix-turn-helix domain-containing protein n=1 Tax=Streptomyces sp. NPDC016845 TaxID=3364972 RepID=UPI00379AF2E8